MNGYFCATMAQETSAEGDNMVRMLKKFAICHITENMC